MIMLKSQRDCLNLKRKNVEGFQNFTEDSTREFYKMLMLGESEYVKSRKKLD